MMKSGFKIPVFLAIFVGLVTILGACAPVYAPGVAPEEGASQPGAVVSEGVAPSEELMGEVAVPEVISVIPAIQLGSTEIVNGDLIVEARVSGFTLDPEAIGKVKVEGTGHWHLYIDGKLAGFSAVDSITISQDKLVEFGSGIHEIKIELHNNDHSLVSETAWAGTQIDFSASMMAPDVSRDYTIDGYSY